MHYGHGTRYRVEHRPTLCDLVVTRHALSSMVFAALAAALGTARPRREKVVRHTGTKHAHLSAMAQADAVRSAVLSVTTELPPLAPLLVTPLTAPAGALAGRERRCWPGP